MKLLFENWRNHLASLETQLLIEGVIKDVKKKYIHISEAVEHLIENLQSFDGIKYLRWAAKQAMKSYDAAKANDHVNPKEPALELAHDMIPQIRKFDESKPRLPKFGFSTDINSYQSFEELRDAVEKVEAEETQKTKRAEEKRTAFSEADILTGQDEGDDFFIVRVYTKKASCYFGKKWGGVEARWCVTRKDQEYFEEYTNDYGQAFYFVFPKYLSTDNRYKKLAFVLDQNLEVQSVWDAPNSSLGREERTEAFVQNLLRQGEDEGAWMTYLWANADRYADEATGSDIKKYNRELKRLGLPTLTTVDEWKTRRQSAPAETEREAARLLGEYKNDVREEIKDWSNEAIRDKANAVMDTIVDDLRHHFVENPIEMVGPTFHDFEEIQDEYDSQIENIWIELQESDNPRYPHWSGGAQFDFVQTDEEGNEYVYDDEDVMKMLHQSADEAGIYLENVESNYDGTVNVLFTADHDEQGLEGFRSWIKRMKDWDEKWDELKADTVKALRRLEISKARKAGFPETKHFELKEKREDLEATAVIELKLPGVLSLLGDLGSMDEVDSHRLRANLKEKTSDLFNRYAIARNIYFKKVQAYIDEAEKIAAKQLNLPGMDPPEKEKVDIPAFDGVFANTNFDVDNETLYTTLVFTIRGARQDDEIEYIVNFIKYLDKHFEEMMQVLTDSTIQMIRGAIKIGLQDLFVFGPPPEASLSESKNKTKLIIEIRKRK
jgi:hypothetical protein